MAIAIEPDELLSTEAARLTGLTAFRLMSLALRGVIRTRVVGGRTFYLREDLIKLREGTGRDDVGFRSREEPQAIRG